MKFPALVFFIAFTARLLAGGAVTVSESETSLASTESQSFPVEIPASFGGNDAVLEITAWLSDKSFRGYSPVMKVSWDGVVLDRAGNRSATFQLADGRIIASVANRLWTLPYTPSPEAIESADTSPYYVPGTGSGITKIQFLISNPGTGSHTVEISHDNPSIPQSLTIGTITLRPPATSSP